MTQEKLSRMVTGIVVAATLFLVVLLGVLVYQWITLGAQQRRIDAALAESAKLESEEAEFGEDLDEVMNDPIWKYDLFLKYQELFENQD